MQVRTTSYERTEEEGEHGGEEASQKPRAWRSKPLHCTPLILIHTGRRTKKGRQGGGSEMEERRRVCLICQNRAVKKREIGNDNDSLG